MSQSKTKSGFSTKFVLAFLVAGLVALATVVIFLQKDLGSASETSHSAWRGWSLETYHNPKVDLGNKKIQITGLHAPSGLYLKRRLKTPGRYELNLEGTGTSEGPINLRVKIDDGEAIYKTAPDGKKQYYFDVTRDLEVLLYSEEPFQYKIEQAVLKKYDGEKIKQTSHELDKKISSRELKWVNKWSIKKYKNPQLQYFKDVIFIKNNNKNQGAGAFFSLQVDPNEVIAIKLRGVQQQGTATLRIQVGNQGRAYHSIKNGDNIYLVDTAGGGELQALLYSDSEFSFRLEHLDVVRWSNLNTTTYRSDSLKASPAFDAEAFSEKSGVAKNTPRAVPGATKIGLAGPANGMIVISGEGDFLGRAIPSLLSPYFDRESLANLKRIAKLPRGSSPTKQQIKMVKKLSRALLYELRRDVRNYYYDSTCSFVSQQRSRDFFPGFMFGPCGFTSSIFSELVQRLGFEVHIVNIGHITAYIRVGSGYLNVDTTYNVVKFFPDQMSIIRGRNSLFSEYTISGNFPIDGLGVNSYLGVTNVMDIPWGASSPMIEYSLPGLPVSLNDNEKFFIDYSGQDTGGVHAVFNSRDQAQRKLHRTFPGRLRKAFFQAELKDNDLSGDGIELKYTLLPSFTNLLLGVSGAIELSSGKVYHADLSILAKSSRCDGRCTYTVFLINKSMSEGIKDGTWDKFYYGNRNLNLNVKIFGEDGKVINTGMVNAASDVFIMEGVINGSKVPNRLTIEVEKQLPKTFKISSDLISGSVRLKRASSFSDFGGINENFDKKGDPIKIAGGKFEVPLSLPYAPYGLDVSVPPGLNSLRSTLAFEISGVAFPFSDAMSDRDSELSFIGEGGTMFVAKREGHLGQIKVMLSSSTKKQENSNRLFSLSVEDSVGQPISNACLDFEGLMDNAFPFIPLYAKDTSRRDLFCRSSTNSRGVATFILEGGTQLPDVVSVRIPPFQERGQAETVKIRGLSNNNTFGTSADQNSER